MQIINDQLTITNATEAQIRNAFKQPSPPATEQPTITPEQQALVVRFMQVINNKALSSIARDASYIAFLDKIHPLSFGVSGWCLGEFVILTRKKRKGES